MEMEDLMRFVDCQYSSRVKRPGTSERVTSIGVAFPQVLPPGVNQYYLESGRNRSSIGIAASALIPRETSTIVLARLSEGVLRAVYNPAREFVQIPVYLNDSLLISWQGNLKDGNFKPTGTSSITGSAELRVLDHSALWVPGGQPIVGSVQFNLAGPHAIEDLTAGMTSASSGLLRHKDQPSRDIVCDLGHDYGVPAFGLMGLILVLRMAVFTYDFC